MFNKVQVTVLALMAFILLGSGLTALIIHDLWQPFLIGLFVALFPLVVRR